MYLRVVSENHTCTKRFRFLLYDNRYLLLSSDIVYQIIVVLRHIVDILSLQAAVSIYLTLCGRLGMYYSDI